MIAIVSDLHLQHTGCDSIRYRRGDEVWEAGVRRNVRAGAFTRFAEAIKKCCQRCKAKEVHLVFAGDILELHRTPMWFMSPDPHVRPYAEDPRPDVDLRRKILAILKAIRQENLDFFCAVNSFASTTRIGNRPCKVHVHYVPGNHDRLANAWPVVRKEVRQMLGITPADGKPFATRLDFTADGDLGDYQVRIRHGHEYDKWNFPKPVANGSALDLGYKEYLKPCFGDHITVDVVARLATAFRVHHAAALRDNDDNAARLRELYQGLLEFDDVRPASLLLEYLATHMGADRKRDFEFLRPVLRDMVDAATADPFFKKEAKRLGIWTAIGAAALREVSKALSLKALSQVISAFFTLRRESGPGPAAIAAHEGGLGGPYDLVVAGHTHKPDQVALTAGGSGAQPMFLDTGTWRTTICHGIGRFARLRAYTMLQCYGQAEREADDMDGRRFETWTGHLGGDKKTKHSARQAAPYDEPVTTQPPPTGPMRLYFRRIQAKNVPEDWFDGAELKLFLGVDAQQRKYTRNWVFDGNVLDLSDVPPIDLDPALDGEIWAHGVEVDLGTNPVNPDDPLPWGIDRLPRDEDTGNFTPTEGKLVVKGKDETHLAIEYQVQPPTSPLGPDD